MYVSASELASDAGSTRGRLERGASLSSSLLKWEAVVFTVWVGAGPGEGALGAAGTAAGLEAGCRKTGGACGKLPYRQNNSLYCKSILGEPSEFEIDKFSFGRRLETEIVDLFGVGSQAFSNCWEEVL